MQLSLRFPLSLLVCLSLLSLAACGSSSSTTNPGNSMTLNVAQNSNSFSYFTLYVAEQEHFFTAQGLTLNPYPPIQLGTGTKTTAAVESNSVELAAGVITDAFTLSRVDSQIKLLGTLSTNLNVDIVVNKSFEQKAHLTANSSLEDKVKALVGKKIGVTSIGAATDAYLIYLFRQYGLDAHKDATVVNLGGSNVVAGLAALRNGRVDALSFPPPTGLEAESQGIGDWFISSKDVPSLATATNCVLYAKQSVIDAKPKAIQAFIRAIAQAEAWIHKNPSQALPLFAKYLKMSPKAAKPIADALMPDFPENPQIDHQGYDAAVQFHVQGGLLAIALAYNDMVATDTLNKALS